MEKTITVDGVQYLEDPNNPGWALGWAVMRNAPWHFVRLFPTRGDALVDAKERGAGYTAAYGSHRIGSDDFIMVDAR